MHIQVGQERGHLSVSVSWHLSHILWVHILLHIVSVSYELAYSLFPCRHAAIQMWVGSVYTLHTTSRFPVCKILMHVYCWYICQYWLTLSTSKLEISKYAFENMYSKKINIQWLYRDNQLSGPYCELKNTPQPCLFNQFLPVSVGTLGQKELYYLPLSARKPLGKWLMSH